MSGCIYQVVYVYAISRPMVQITVTYWSPIAINHNRRDYSLFPGGSGCDFQNAFFNIDLMVGNFRSTPDSTSTLIQQYLSHDETTLLQLMAWCHRGQQAITPYITEANIDPNLCHYMVLLAGWVNVSHFEDALPQSVDTMRPRQNDHHIQHDMFTWIFLNEIYQFRLKFYWCFLLRAQFTITSIGSGNGLVPTRNKQSSEPWMA